MVRKYLRIEIEGKGIMVDLDYINPEEIKLQIGELKGKDFISNKQLSLKDLQEGGFE